MLKNDFEGLKYGYSYNIETGFYTLYNKENKIRVTLNNDDGFMFKEHLELINIEQNNTLNERTERVIEIHFNFSTKPCPMPHFVEA